MPAFSYADYDRAERSNTPVLFASSLKESHPLRNVNRTVYMDGPTAARTLAQSVREGLTGPNAISVFSEIRRTYDNLTIQDADLVSSLRAANARAHTLAKAEGSIDDNQLVIAMRLVEQSEPLARKVEEAIRNDPIYSGLNDTEIGERTIARVRAVTMKGMADALAAVPYADDPLKQENVRSRWQENARSRFIRAMGHDPAGNVPSDVAGIADDMTYLLREMARVIPTRVERLEPIFDYDARQMFPELVAREMERLGVEGDVPDEIDERLQEAVFSSVSKEEIELAVQYRELSTEERLRIADMAISSFPPTYRVREEPVRNEVFDIVMASEEEARVAADILRMFGPMRDLPSRDVIDSYFEAICPSPIALNPDEREAVLIIADAGRDATELARVTASRVPVDVPVMVVAPDEETARSILSGRTGREIAGPENVFDNRYGQYEADFGDRDIALKAGQVPDSALISSANFVIVAHSFPNVPIQSPLKAAVRAQEIRSQLQAASKAYDSLIEEALGRIDPDLLKKRKEAQGRSWRSVSRQEINDWLQKNPKQFDAGKGDIDPEHVAKLVVRDSINAAELAIRAKMDVETLKQISRLKNEISSLHQSLAAAEKDLKYVEAEWQAPAGARLSEDRALIARLVERAVTSSRQVEVRRVHNGVIEKESPAKTAAVAGRLYYGHSPDLAMALRATTPRGQKSGVGIIMSRVIASEGAREAISRVFEADPRSPVLVASDPMCRALEEILKGQSASRKILDVYAWRVEGKNRAAERSVWVDTGMKSTVGRILLVHPGGVIQEDLLEAIIARRAEMTKSRADSSSSNNSADAKLAKLLENPLSLQDMMAAKMALMPNRGREFVKELTNWNATMAVLEGIVSHAQGVVVAANIDQQNYRDYRSANAIRMAGVAGKLLKTIDSQGNPVERQEAMRVASQYSYNMSDQKQARLSAISKEMPDMMMVPILRNIGVPASDIEAIVPVCSIPELLRLSKKQDFSKFPDISNEARRALMNTSAIENQIIAFDLALDKGVSAHMNVAYRGLPEFPEESLVNMTTKAKYLYHSGPSFPSHRNSVLLLSYGNERLTDAEVRDIQRFGEKAREQDTPIVLLGGSVRSLDTIAALATLADRPDMIVVSDETMPTLAILDKGEERGRVSVVCHEVIDNKIVDTWGHAVDLATSLADRAVVASIPSSGPAWKAIKAINEKMATPMAVLMPMDERGNPDATRIMEPSAQALRSLARPGRICVAAGIEQNFVTIFSSPKAGHEMVEEERPDALFRRQREARRQPYEAVVSEPRYVNVQWNSVQVIRSSSDLDAFIQGDPVPTYTRMSERDEYEKRRIAEHQRILADPNYAKRWERNARLAEEIRAMFSDHIVSDAISNEIVKGDSIAAGFHVIEADQVNMMRPASRSSRTR